MKPCAREYMVFGVEEVRKAHCQREVAGTVPSYYARDHGDAERSEPAAQQSSQPVLLPGELPEYDSRGRSEDSCEFQLRDHSLDSVEGLSDLLEKQQTPTQIRKVRGAEQGAHDRQIAAEQDAVRSTGTYDKDTAFRLRV